MHVEVWEPLAYRDHQLRDHLWLLVPVTVLVVLALALLAHAFVRRDIALLAFSGWLVSAGLHALVHMGYLYRHVFDQGGELALRIPFVAAQAWSFSRPRSSTLSWASGTLPSLIAGPVRDARDVALGADDVQLE